jgi:hypothetical protein
MLHHTRRGYTLVEMLVMIAVIAFLGGVLLFAVQKCCAEAARIKCARNREQPASAGRHGGGVHGKLPRNQANPQRIAEKGAGKEGKTPLSRVRSSQRVAGPAGEGKDGLERRRETHGD